MEKLMMFLLVFLLTLLWSGGLGVQMKLAAPRPEMTLQPQKIIAGFTRNVSLVCELPLFNATLNRLRISKLFNGSWKTVGQNIAGTETIRELNFPEISSNLKPANGKPFVRLAWDIARGEIFGTYKCWAFRYDNYAFYSNDSLIVDFHEQCLTGQDIEGFWDQVEVRIVSALKDCTADEELVNVQIKEYSRHLKRYIDKAKCHGERPVDGEFPMYDDDKTWRLGQFALLKSRSGCPAQFMESVPSYINIHEESNSGRGCLSQGRSSHLSTPVAEAKAYNCFLYLRFCESNATHTQSIMPEGKYCINKLKSKQCPDGMKPSTLKLDIEDNDSVRKADGRVAYYQSHAYIPFCCDTRGSHYQPLSLPRRRPFYLYRYGGMCQQVSGMNVKEEYIDIDTEDTDNDDGFGASDDVRPDVEIQSGRPTRIHVCYYTSIKSA